MDKNMPLLGFGAMRLPTLGAETKIDLPQVNQMVDLFLEKGYRYFDTAYVYHGGHSETALKEALVKRHPRDSYVVATKLPIWSVRKAADMKRIFEESLTRMGLEMIDYYLIHALDASRIQPAADVGAFEFTQQLKKEGKIRFAGFSYHDTAEVLDKLLTAHPEQDFVQLQINYLDMKAGPAESWYQVARKHNKPIIIMEPVKGGSLAKLQPTAEAIFKKANPNASAASWALRYAASLPGVFTVLSGMSDFAQVKDNVNTFDNFQPLTPEEEKVIENVLAEMGKASVVPCTACKYCLESCPQQIAIPEIFSAYNTLRRSAPDEQWKSKRLYASIPARHKAEDCIACHACEEHCPQGIRIPDELKAAGDALV